MVRFYTVTLFAFDFPSNFPESLLATQYVACFFSLLGVPRRVKRDRAFPKIFTFDSGSFMQVLSNKIVKTVYPKYGAILPRQVIPSSVPN